ncbi:MAG: glycosyltransferase [Sphingobacteriaceae bacterium]|nr:glycosyltransferase [Sphingobacteriaceae bacterium]
MKRTKKLIVVSGINIHSGGPVTIYKAILEELSKLSHEFDIYALVNNDKLFTVKNIKYFTFSRFFSRNVLSFYYEYYYFNKLSKKWKPDVWISVNDKTPTVTVPNQVVYFHNSSLFYSFSFKTFWIEPIFYLQRFIYKFILKMNASKNRYIIVQQEWLKKKLTGLYLDKKIIVANPEIDSIVRAPVLKSSTEKFTFFYPSLPRAFKNFELIVEAVKFLNKMNPKLQYEVLFTLSGYENRYAKYVKAKAKGITQIKFVGHQTKEGMESLYLKSDTLIFPSLLETWGLPISEAMNYNLKILLVDLPYAHETLGSYNKGMFFKKNDVVGLANYMKMAISGELLFESTKKVELRSDLYFNRFDKLIEFILK